jgi:hypothetical protein
MESVGIFPVIRREGGAGQQYNAQSASDECRHKNAPVCSYTSTV